MNEKNSKLTISIEMDNPCFHCNGDCDACPHWVDTVDYDAIATEAESFRLSLSVDMRKHDHIEISL